MSPYLFWSWSLPPSLSLILITFGNLRNQVFIYHFSSTNVKINFHTLLYYYLHCLRSQRLRRKLLSVLSVFWKCLLHLVFSLPSFSCCSCSDGSFMACLPLCSRRPINANFYFVLVCHTSISLRLAHPRNALSILSCLESPLLPFLILCMSRRCCWQNHPWSWI
jgi:hypothetical protein